MAGTPHVAGTVVPSADLNDRVKIYDRSTSTVTVASTVTETSLYLKTIAAGHMSTDRLLRLTLSGNYAQSTGSNQLGTFRVKFGGTTLIHDAISFASDANTRGWKIIVEVQNLASASVQDISMHYIGAITAITAATVGNGAIDVGLSGFVQNAGAVNTAIARDLEVTIELGVSSASFSWVKKRGFLELG